MIVSLSLPNKYFSPSYSRISCFM